MRDAYAEDVTADLRLVGLEAESAKRVEKIMEAQKELAEEQDRAARALTIAVLSAIAIGLPLLALVAGLSWRLFRWAAGV